MKTSIFFLITMIFLASNVHAWDYEVTKVASNCASSCRGRGGYGFGEYRDGRSFICWPGPQMKPQVKMFDHTTKSWSSIVEVDQASDNPDRHDYPMLTIGPDGYVHVFYSMHNGPFYHAKSPAPLSVEGSWKVNRVSGGATYPYPACAPNGDIVVFYRRGWAYNGYLECIRSTDNGNTFGSGKKVIECITANGSKKYGIYQWALTVEPLANNDMRYHLLWNYRDGADIWKGRYFAYYYPLTGKLTNAAGVDLGDMITVEEADQYCNLHNGTTSCFWISSASSYCDNGNPLFFYSINEKDLTCARWDGSAWQKSTVYTSNFSDVEDVEKFGPESFRIVYRNRAGDSRSVVSVVSTDAGKTWAHEQLIFLPDSGKLGKVGILENFHPEMKMFISNDLAQADLTGNYDVYMVSELGSTTVNRQLVPFNANRYQTEWIHSFDLLGRSIPSLDLDNAYRIRITQTHKIAQKILTLKK